MALSHEHQMTAFLSSMCSKNGRVRHALHVQSDVYRMLWGPPPGFFFLNALRLIVMGEFVSCSAGTCVL